ncbi:MAG: phosphatase PAP2 family protein [Planctomycetota bacterium]
MRAAIASRWADTWRPGALPTDQRERLLLVGLLWVYTFGGYYLLGLTGDPKAARSLHTAVDAAIPFQPWMMYFYEGVYTALLYPLFTVRCQRLFRRTALAYCLVTTVSLAIWIAFPVSAYSLRADTSTLDLSRFVEWGVKVNYALDPSLNCFPSLHLAITLLAALCALTARRLWGVFGILLSLAVAYAICAVKQHFFLDGVGGALIALGAYALIVRPYDPGESAPEELAFTWRGPAAYLAFHLAAVLAFAIAWKLGWAPWEQVRIG